MATTTYTEHAYQTVTSSNKTLVCSTNEPCARRCTLTAIPTSPAKFAKILQRLRQMLVWDLVKPLDLWVLAWRQVVLAYILQSPDD